MKGAAEGVEGALRLHALVERLVWARVSRGMVIARREPGWGPEFKLQLVFRKGT